MDSHNWGCIYIHRCPHKVSSCIAAPRSVLVLCTEEQKLAGCLVRSALCHCLQRQPLKDGLEQAQRIQLFSHVELLASRGWFLFLFSSLFTCAVLYAHLHLLRILHYNGQVNQMTVWQAELILRNSTAERQTNQG